MAKCSVCARPVISGPHVLATGQLIHDECRAGLFLPRARPKVIGPRSRSGAATGTLHEGGHPESGFFTNGRSRVLLFIAAGDDALRMYQALAVASGCQVELARDGYEAVLLAQLARPDAVVLDVSDGHLDGRRILARLRANLSTRARPLVLVGSSSSEGLESAGERPPCVVPGGDPFEVLRAVERLLAVAEAAGATG